MGLRNEDGAPRSVPIAIGILRALVIAARRARLKMDSERGFLGDERLVALAIAIIEARFGFSDQRAEFDARPDARKLADGFHSSVPGFDLPFGRRAVAASSTRSRTVRDTDKIVQGLCQRNYKNMTGCGEVVGAGGSGCKTHPRRRSFFVTGGGRLGGWADGWSESF